MTDEQLNGVLNNPRFLQDVAAAGASADLQALAAEMRANHQASKAARWAEDQKPSDEPLRYRMARLRRQKEEEAHASEVEGLCSGCNGRTIDGRCASNCSRYF